MDDQLNILPLSSHASSIKPIPARTEVTGERGEGERGRGGEGVRGRGGEGKRG